jgi:uncharacterized membrane protein
VGVDPVVLGAPFADALRSLEAALLSRTGFPTFLEALRSLGPILGRALPRQADDVNELPDEPST